MNFALLKVQKSLRVQPFSTCSHPIHRSVPGEQPVYKNLLSNCGLRLKLVWFFERTEKVGDNQKLSWAVSRIIPGEPGKGWVKLVGPAPRMPDLKDRLRRQDSPVPLTTVARRQLPRTRDLAVRPDEKPGRAESSNTNWFRVRVNRGYPVRVHGCYRETSPGQTRKPSCVNNSVH